MTMLAGSKLSSRIAAALCLLAIGLSVLSLIAGIRKEDAGEFPRSGLLAGGLDPTMSLTGTIVDTLIGLSFALVGGLIATRRPGNIIGWALLFGGLGVLHSLATPSYGELAISEDPAWWRPLVVLAYQAGAAGWVPMIVAAFLLLLLFPDRRQLPTAWRVCALVAVGGFTLVWLAYLTSQHLTTPYEDLSNPLHPGGPDFTQAADVLQMILLVPISLAAIDLVRRFRRSRGDERAQFKWLTAAAALLVVSFPISIAGEYVGPASLPMAAALIGLPVAVGIAVLKHRLYDIDRLISRTLVFALLSAGLAFTYFGLVVALQELLKPLSGGSDLAIVVTTLVVAALSFPARNSLQDAVDRRFYRRRYDASRTIDDFSLRLRQQVDLVTLQDELLEVVEGTMQPATVSLWLRRTTPPDTRTGAA